MMRLNSPEELITDIQKGRMVILMDDEKRENEGDLIIAAEYITPEAIRFMLQHTSGIICLTITEAIQRALALPFMVPQTQNASRYGTAFTVSIEAAEGVSTGVSAQDRATTIRAAVSSAYKKGDIVSPGHIFPVVAHPEGVLARAGHTEASVALATLAQLTPAAVLAEVMLPNGCMARRPQLEHFASTHQLSIGTVYDLQHYIRNKKPSLEEASTLVREVE